MGDRVLDPFWGTGNTSLGAIQMYRSSIGIEIEPEYINTARKRLSTVPDESSIEIVER